MGVDRLVADIRGAALEPEPAGDLFGGPAGLQPVHHSGKQVGHPDELALASAPLRSLVLRQHAIVATEDGRERGRSGRRGQRSET